MLPEDDRTQEEILGRSPDWIDHHPDPREAVGAVPFLPATLSLVFALLGFCALQVYAVLGGGWRWSVVGVIFLVAGLFTGTFLQNYANRRKQ